MRGWKYYKDLWLATNQGYTVDSILNTSITTSRFGPWHSTPFDLWTPESYINCNASSIPLADNATAEYEVLHHAHSNRIRFLSNVNGLFLFRLRLVDPAFSFCTLETTFGVNVYGAPLPPATQAVIVTSFMMSVILVLIVSYFMYRKTRLGSVAPMGLGVGKENGRPGSEGVPVVKTAEM